jgi:hypothetical protein
MGGSLRRASEDGRLPNLDAVLQVRHSVVSEGASAGHRAVDLTPWGGIALRILPDRGFDILNSSYRGTPLAWISRVGEAPPGTELECMAWAGYFGGGLLTTCGLRNVGMPSEGHGLHGTFSHLRAEQVVTDRRVDENESCLIARAVLEDGASPSALRVERTITTAAGRGKVEVADRTINIGAAVAEAPFLYHLNFGYPLWDEPARLDIPAIETVPRDLDSERSLRSWRVPPVVETGPERVLEHVLEGGEGRARLSNPRLGVEVTVRWDRSSLPRLHQWIDPNPGMYVLGIEPANCSTSGRAHDRAEDGLPTLEPGEVRTTRLVVEAGPA